jgi:hypothetical protein
MKKILLMPLLMVLLAGCSTMGGTVETRFSETVTGEDGNPVTTTYEATSKAGFLGELEQSNHQFSYSWGGDENVISTGQSGTGQSNAGNAILVEAISAGITAGLGTLESVLLKKIDVQAAAEAARAANPDAQVTPITILELLRSSQP